MFTIGFFVPLTNACVSSVFLLSVFFPHASTLLFRKGNGKTNFVCFHRVRGVFVLYVKEIDLAEIALSCHFALDSLCYKEGGYDSV